MSTWVGSAGVARAQTPEVTDAPRPVNNPSSTSSSTSSIETSIAPPSPDASSHQVDDTRAHPNVAALTHVVPISHNPLKSAPRLYAAIDPPISGVGLVLAEAPKQPGREVYKLHLAVDIPVTIVGGALGLGRELFLNTSLVRRTCPCDPAGLNRLDRLAVNNHSRAASIAADVTVYGAMVALPVADLIDLGFDRAWGEDLMVYLEVLAVDTGLQNLTNYGVARPRPRTYAGDPAFLNSGEGYLSFYAGHVATAFAGLSAAAFTMRHRYGEQVWPWIVAALIGSSVAVERVASGHHFPTDVTVAAVVGTAIGITVPWLHLRRGETQVRIAPVGANSLGLVGVF